MFRIADITLPLIVDDSATTTAQEDYMAKSSGLGNLFYIAGADLSGDIGALDNISAPRNAVDITGINSSAVERIYTHGSGQIDFSCFFNDAAGQAHLTLRALQ